MIQEPPIPDRIDLIASMASLTIRRKWLTWHIVPTAIFAAVWDSFLVFWYSGVISNRGDMPWIAVVFPLGHVAVGIGLTYYVLATLLNTTDVKIAPERISVSTYPLPWGRSRNVSSQDIVDVRVKESGSTRGQRSFSVRFRDRGNRDKPLVAGGLDDDQAEFIAFHLRKVLNLKPEA